MSFYVFFILSIIDPVWLGQWSRNQFQIWQWTSFFFGTFQVVVIYAWLIPVNSLSFFYLSMHLFCVRPFELCELWFQLIGVCFFVCNLSMESRSKKLIPYYALQSYQLRDITVWRILLYWTRSTRQFAFCVMVMTLFYAGRCYPIL